MCTVPFPWRVIPHPGEYTRPLFEGVARWTGENIFNLTQPFTVSLESDSTGLYLHTFVVALLALVLLALWQFTLANEWDQKKVNYVAFMAARHYLALQLLIYGFDKIFKLQFYAPEPNSLFTPMGELPHDFLYWSAVGSSRGYSFFAGLVEVIPALLLLWRPTARIGAMIAAAVMCHVVALNFTFDISVKLYSLFLLWLAVFLLLPDLRRLFQTLVLNVPVPFESWVPKWETKPRLLFYSFAKPALVGLILFESLFIYFRTGNFNDDAYPRPYLWGAYEVETFVKNGDTLAPLITDTARFRRVFVHRRGYFIAQKMNDEMVSYGLRYDRRSQRLFVKDRKGKVHDLRFTFNESTGMLTVNGVLTGDTLALEARRIALDSLPLRQPGFHWTIDGFNPVH